jgi:hypothetical protein
MANQLWLWSRALEAIKARPDFDEVTLLLHYPPLEGNVILPHAEFKDWVDNGFQPVDKTDLTTCTGECICVNAWDLDSNWEAAASNFKTIKPSQQILNVMAFLSIPSNCLGMHIRYGDLAQPGTHCQKHGDRATQDFYLTLLKFAKQFRFIQPVFVASNAHFSELKWLPLNTCLLSPAHSNPIVDMLALSRCQIIIGSRSTFSRAAAAIGGIKWISPDSPIDESLTLLRNALT